MNRRTLLRATVAVPALAALAACGASLSQVTSDVQTIASGLAGIMPQISSIPGIAASSVAKLSGYLADLKSLASQVAANATPSATTIQQVASDVQAFADLALPLIPGGAVYVVAINAALALLPGLLAAVGVSAGSLEAPEMTPAQARSVLSSFAH
jgi:hypothetical protein